MSGHPQGGHYDDGYGHHQEGNTDSYYQDDQSQGYYDNNGAYADGHHADGHHAEGHSQHQQHPQGADGYYDES